MKDFIYTPIAYQNGNNLYDERDIKQVYKNYVSDFEKNQQLQARIKELESKKHINEIKAQGIEEFMNQVAMDCMYDEDPVIVLERVSNYADKLRTNQ